MELNSSRSRTSDAARDFLMELSMRLPQPEEPESDERETEAASSTISEAEIKEQLLRALRAKTSPSQRLVIKSGSRMLFLHPEKIEWVEAEKDYVRLHAGKENHLVRETMNDIEKKLQSERFVRVHRSTIVNLDHVREMKPLPSGEYDISMRDGTQLRLSRGYRARLMDLLRDSF
ncbi:MAG: LytR/AlgR family response regulator transcription factor [Terriglobales bacterium]|jgi:DNA-binding LytR/AlgR family response regulator